MIYEVNYKHKFLKQKDNAAKDLGTSFHTKTIKLLCWDVLDFFQKAFFTYSLKQLLNLTFDAKFTKHGYLWHETRKYRMLDNKYMKTIHSLFFIKTPSLFFSTTFISEIKEIPRPLFTSCRITSSANALAFIFQNSGVILQHLRKLILYFLN